MRQTLQLWQKQLLQVEGSMAGSFIQTPTAKSLENYAAEKADLQDLSSQELLAFHSGTHNEGYGPASDSNGGIQKQMHDEMSAEWQVQPRTRRMQSKYMRDS